MRRFLITFLTIAIFFAVGCQSKKPTTLSFIPVINDQPAECNNAFLINAQQWRLNTFQFYISKIKLDDEKQKIKYAANLKDLNNDVALVGGNCSGQLNWQIELNSQSQANTNLEFELAIPFELNHQNPLTAKFPLNQSDMFWTWQLGHKFLRLDLDNQTDPEQNWFFHLGSTGCDSASVMRSPTKPCKNPNRMNFKLDNFETNKPIYISLTNLISNLALNSQSTCMGDLDQIACRVLHKNLNNNIIFTQDIEQLK